MPDNDATEVTAAGIARLAGVGRAAVSNWRRRHPDFPQPVGGTETSPSFALTKVEAWLREQGKLAEVPLRERVWQQLAGHPAGPSTALRHVGCALLLVHTRPADWRELSALPDERAAELLPGPLDAVLTQRLGPADERAVRVPGPAELAPSLPLLRATADLARDLGLGSETEGPQRAYEFLVGRHLDANPRQYPLTPTGPAELMAALAGPADTALDPACGTGALLSAVTPRPGQRLYGQDSAPELAALTALRLALRTDAAVRTAAADTLRADALESVIADVVLCHPPFNERNWGHDELAYDPRWEYGFPARTESELAWVQHALARLREGGTAVLLMPPAAASRRSGRRIRADLLRRGALRAVIALPAGAAPPHSIPLHLWVLRGPDGAAATTPEVLLVETSALVQDARDSRDKLPWQTVRDAALAAWTAFDRQGTAAETPGLSRAVPVIELLDDDVDLTPARHLPPPAAGGGAETLAALRGDLATTLRRTVELTPAAADPAQPVRWPTTTVGELARGGALTLRMGSAGGHARVPVLTDHDVLAGTAPSGTLTEGDTGDEPVLVEEGDIIVPVLGGGTVARVADAATAGAALGRNLCLLRPDPAALDPWFLAGFLRGTANNRQASSYASTATRLDVRRLQLPRIPLERQRAYGERFRTLAAFEEALRLAGRLGERLIQGTYDGLTDGTIDPG
ncbi:N-6 DNA methylase [Streptomyces apocyni]|uniref:N-6 DNA methylase n=1 Tax=Streptomyces apocyni TaxID=2654677 RepID=UPI0012EAC999|nr:N-6 DNA methylase [Streptomyces apocyni]